MDYYEDFGGSTYSGPTTPSFVNPYPVSPIQSSIAPTPVGTSQNWEDFSSGNWGGLGDFTFVLNSPWSMGGDYGIPAWVWEDIYREIEDAAKTEAGGTAPLVPVYSDPAPVDTSPVQIDPNWDHDYEVPLEPGVDLGNDGVPASDVVTGGAESLLEGDQDKLGINLLLSSLGLTGASTGLISALAGQDRRPTRTTEAVFGDMPEFTKLTPTLLSPLYRS